MISRRQALATLAAAGVWSTTTFDPERLLWVPGAKTIFLPTNLDDSLALSYEEWGRLLHARFVHMVEQYHGYHA